MHKIIMLHVYIINVEDGTSFTQFYICMYVLYVHTYGAITYIYYARGGGET